MVMPYGFDSRFSHHKKASTSVLAFFVPETNIDPSLCYPQIGFAFLTKIACSSLTRSWTKIAPLGAFPFQRSSTLVLAFFVLEIKKKKAQFAPPLVNKKRCPIMLHFAKSISPAKDNSNSRNKADNADN